MLVIGTAGNGGDGGTPDRPQVAYVPRPDLATVEGDILPTV
jgi:hypothetical protein